MTKRKTRNATWLLTVASAYSLLPGCSEEPSTGKPDANVHSSDSGSTASRPPRSDAAAPQDSGSDGGGGEAIDAGEEIDFPALIGVIIFPPGGGDLLDLDGGFTDTPAADDAGAADADRA